MAERITMDLTAIWSERERTLTLHATSGRWEASIDIHESQGFASLPQKIDELRDLLVRVQQLKSGPVSDELMEWAEPIFAADQKETSA
jgi:hypothetical protein